MLAATTTSSVAQAQVRPPLPERAEPQPPQQPRSPEARPNTEGQVDLRPRFTLGLDRRIILRQQTSQTLPSSMLDANDDEPAAPTSTPNGKQPKKTAPGKTTKPAAEQRSTGTTELSLVFRPTGVTTEETTVDVVIESIKATRKSADKEDAFDSTKPPKAKAPAKTKPSTKSPTKAPTNAPAGSPADEPAESPDDMIERLMEEQSLESRLKPLVGEKMTLRLNADGEITSVQGGEKLAQALSPLGGGLESLQALGGANTPSSEDLFKSILSGPGKPFARVGESWDSVATLDLAVLSSVKLRTRNTLASMRGTLAQIDSKTTMEPSSESPTKAGQSAPKLEVNAAGSCQWDAGEGFLHSLSSRETTTVRLNFGSEPMTMTSESTTTITRADAAGRRGR